MKDPRRTIQELLEENTLLKQKIQEQEQSESERRRVSESLSGSEAYFKAIIQNSSDIILVVDKLANITYASPSVERILGYRPDELVGTRTLDLIVSDDKSRSIADFRRALLIKEGLIPNNFRIKHKDGTERIFEGVGSNLLDNPIVAGFVMNIRDITDRKRADTDLQASKAQLSNALEMAHLGHWEYDVADDLFTFNDQFYKVFRTTAEQMGGYTMHSAEYAHRFVHPDDIAVVGEEIRKAVETTDPHFNRQIEHRMLYADGTVGHISVRFFIVKDSHGRTVKTYGVNQDITERKQVEEALRESEKKYRDLYDFLPISFVEIDTKGAIISFNRKCLEIFRYKQEDFKEGMTALQFFDPSQLERFGVNIQRVTDGTSTPGQEFLFLRKDGSTFPGLIFASNMIQANKIVGIRAAIIDITERKQAEEKLRESEEKFRWVLDNISDVISVMDMNLRFTYVSPSILRMRGYTDEEATAQTFEQVMTPESMQIAAKVFEEEMKMEASGTADPNRIRIVEVEQYRKDGSIVVMENSLSFMRDKAQKPVGIISVSRDITDRKRDEAKLRQQTDAMDAVVDGMALLNEDGEYIYLNKAHVMLYGYESDEELIGKSWRVLYDSDSLKRFDQEIMPEFSRKGYWSGEATGMKKDGTKFPQALSLTAMANGGLICVVRDITERMQIEEALKKTLENLRKAFGTTIQVMVAAVESRDPYTAGHQLRSANLARAIATEMGLPHEKIEGIRMAASIHDIGKLSIPAEILSKPTRLSDIEFSLIKEHPQKGYEMLKDVESPWPLAQIVYQHHERMDGSGYPRNLKGDEILIEARIMAVADVVEAMGSHRPYRPTVGLNAALEEIKNNTGMLYDTDVVDACLRLFREKGFQLDAH